MVDAYRESMIILPTVRCPYRCKFCAYHNDAQNITSERPSVDFLIQETEKKARLSGKAIAKNSELYIVNSGSFLDERQIPREYNDWLVNYLKGKNLNLILECRADSKVENYKEDISRLLGVTEKLTFAIGVEAYRPDMGNETFKRLGKGITKDKCIEQSEKLRSYGASTKAYILVGPPWLGGPSYLREGYRKSIDWLIETAFLTAKFSVEEMKVNFLGMGPFFPYKGTNEAVPDDWAPTSVTEAAEVANQLRQVFPEARMDFTGRQMHFAFGNFFRFRNLKKPVDASNPEQVLAVRENVAQICQSVFGKRGKISQSLNK